MALGALGEEVCVVTATAEDEDVDIMPEMETSRLLTLLVERARALMERYAAQLSDA